jgi:D-beta-D-heptose 7-phosphate kinase/D-beta-D-heptose 1-phosphate adenosyltransferase
VDYVTIFSEPDPLKLIEALEPDILVKGADWPLDKIIGGPFVQQKGGDVVRIPLIPKTSTTGIIEKIVKRFGESSSIRR